MSTTTIRIPPELKARAARVAERGGATTHAFVLEAIEQHVLHAEARLEFLHEGGERLAEMETSGVAVPWDELRQYLLDRVAGTAVTRPVARRIGSAKPAGKRASRARKTKTA